ncbi:MAG: PKD domain-containing protein, partial [bacterium]
MLSMARTRLMLLAVALIFLVACGHGGGPSVPTIISVTPSGTVGADGDSVGFAVIASVTGTPHYAWDFDDGATPNNPTTANPTVTLEAGGTYSGTIAVTDDLGTTSTGFSYTVTAVIPEVSGVLHAPSTGLPGGTMHFLGAATGHPTSWAWTWDDGVEPLTSSSTEPDVMCLDPGSYTGSVIVSNGAGDSDPFPFAFTVGEPVAPSWDVVELPGTVETQSGIALSMITFDDRLAVMVNTPAGIVFYRALVSNPLLPSDWHSHVVDPDGFARAIQSMAIAGDRLALLYFAPVDGIDQLRIAIANVAEPGSPTDWDTHDIMVVGTGLSAAIVAMNDRLAVVTGTGFTQCAISDDFAPTSAGDWSIHLIGGAEGYPQGNCTGLLFANGRLQIAGLDGVINLPRFNFLARALVSVPSAPEDWLVMNTGDVDYFSDGQPSLAATSAGLALVDAYNTIQLRTCSGFEPEDFSDWTSQKAAEIGRVAADPRVVSVANRLFLVYYDLPSLQLYMRRQTGAGPADLTHWSAPEPLP